MNMKLVIDSVLVESCRAGNEKAYQELFRRYFSRLCSYTRKCIADAPASEELVMDVMLTIWQKKHLLNGDLPLFPYLFQSVKNRIIDHLRKQNIPTVSLDYHCPEAASPLIADSRLLHKELECIYKTGLEQLPPKKKLIFRMSREEGNSYQEIADKLRISKNTVENHMVAAIRLLRTHVRSANYN